VEAGKAALDAYYSALNVCKGLLPRPDLRIPLQELRLKFAPVKRSEGIIFSKRRAFLNAVNLKSQTMILQTYAPSPLLGGYVRQYLHWKSTMALPTTTSFIPRGLSTLVFVLNPEEEHEFRVVCPVAKALYDQSDIYLFGQTTSVWFNEVSGCWDLLFAILQPAGMHHLLREKAGTVTDQYSSLSAWYPESKLVSEQVAAQRDIYGQVATIDRFLVRLFSRATPKAGEVDNALFHILGSQGGAGIETIARKERISVRTLHRKFTEQVGLAPKAYARIVRFRSLMQYALAHPQASWLDLTTRYNYYDQAHLIKDFYHFTGSSPAQYLTKNQLIDDQFLKNF
jgi:AraC-like DNA-binding protein